MAGRFQKNEESDSGRTGETMGDEGRGGRKYHKHKQTFETWLQLMAFPCTSSYTQHRDKGGGTARRGRVLPYYIFFFGPSGPCLAKLQTAVRDEAARGAEEEVYFESCAVHYSAARRG